MLTWTEVWIVPPPLAGDPVDPVTLDVVRSARERAMLPIDLTLSDEEPIAKQEADARRTGTTRATTS